MLADDEVLELLRDLNEAGGPPGFEDEVREVMKRYLSPLAEISNDRLGSLIGRKEGTAPGPKIAIAGHLDEVGFMVTDITEGGYLKFQTLGGWWEQVMLAQRVDILTRKGRIVGVVGSKPPHVLTPEQRKKMVEKQDMYIDIGVANREEAEEAGVALGDPIVPICPFIPMANPKYLLAKSWDNRVGCGAVVQLLRTLKDVQHPNTVYGIANVQEEVGLRGAATSTYMVEPDVGFAVDVSIPGDTPGMKPEDAKGKLGEGPVILLYDGSLVPHRKLRDLVIETAREEDIPIQFDSLSGGGTDAGRMHLFGSGVPSLVISVASRYIHSAANIIHRDDFDHLVKLLKAVVLRLDEKVVRTLHAY